MFGPTIISKINKFNLRFSQVPLVFSGGKSNDRKNSASGFHDGSFSERRQFLKRDEIFFYECLSRSFEEVWKTKALDEPSPHCS